MSQYIRYPAGTVTPSGTVVGPGSATDTAIARFQGASGKAVENSLVLIDNSGNITTPANINPSGDDSGPQLGEDGKRWSQLYVDLANVFTIQLRDASAGILNVGTIEGNTVDGVSVQAVIAGNQLLLKTADSGADENTGNILITTGNTGEGTSGSITLQPGSSDATVGTIILQGHVSASYLNVPNTVTANAVTAKIISNPEHAAGTSGAATTFDLSEGAFQKLDMTDNCTFTLDNPTAGTVYCLKLTQTSAGGYAYTWPVTVKWPGGTGPTGSATGKIDVITLLYDGTSYYGTFGLNY